MKDLCKRCSLCCSFYIKFLGREIILPSYKCKHFKDNACDIYETRSCAKGKDLLNKHMVPNSCGYATPGYQGREVANKTLETIIFNNLSDNLKQKLTQGFDGEENGLQNKKTSKEKK